MIRPVQPHPSQGGSKGYSPEYRREALQNFANGRGGAVTASRSSLWRWRQRNQALIQQGNAAKTNMQGEHKLLLVMYRLAYPKAMASEIIQFIAMNSINPHIYSRTDIFKCEEALGFTRKVGSTTANQAGLPINIIKRQMFWNLPPPLGIATVNRHHLIDIDEAGIQLKFANRSHGKSLAGIQVRQRGLYGHREKYTLIVAIGTTGVLHLRFEKEAGTTVAIFNQFVDQLCNQYLPPLPPRKLMYDNLKAHLSNLVCNTITASGHTYIQRAPYRPVDGPIEYFFNMLQQELTHRMHLINNEADLRQQIVNIAQGFTGFDGLFQKCGY